MAKHLMSKVKAGAAKAEKTVKRAADKKKPVKPRSKKK